MSSNCKVHFAGGDNDPAVISVLRCCDVRYRLFTAYPFIKTEKSSYRVKSLSELQARFSHVIIDSGLFTLMFGAQKGKAFDKNDMRSWMKRIVTFAADNKINDASFVECDCQKIIGAAKAWDIRREMRELMDGREVINVFHIEDGQDGFEQLVEFSDYLAISVPELRIHKPGQYKNMVTALVRKARSHKPDIKIHLLGCTERKLLVDNKNVTSADSSSWLAPVRYGSLMQYRTNNLKAEFKNEAAALVIAKSQELGFEIKNPTAIGKKTIAMNYLSAGYCLSNYRKWCGSQE